MAVFIEADQRRVTHPSKVSPFTRLRSQIQVNQHLGNGLAFANPERPPRLIFPIRKPELALKVSSAGEGESGGEGGGMSATDGCWASRLDHPHRAFHRD